MISRIVLPVLVSCSLKAFAGDAAELDFIGFSEDGGYCAYSESGTQDGSGFPYCSIRAVRTAGAVLEGSVDIVLDDFEGEAVVADPVRTAMRTAKSFLFALGVRPGEEGFHALHHPLSDLGVSPDTVLFSTMNAPEPWGGSYRIVLEAEATEDSSLMADWGIEPATAELWLEDTWSGARAPLALEPLRPGRERYTWAYRINDVYVMNDDVVVVLVCAFSLGFEGSDVRFVSACGRLSQLEK
jgi:hypothetical protein